MSKRQQKLKSEIGAFLNRYKRKAQPSGDPNDRSYSLEIESMVKRMSPAELDALIHGTDEDLELPKPHQDKLRRRLMEIRKAHRRQTK